TSEPVGDWIATVETTHYLIGSCVGPHPYPEIVRELQAVIGQEARGQILEAEGRLPQVAVACVGGGSNAIGLFAGFLDDDVRLIGVEAGGAASLGTGRTAVLHGSRSSVLADEDGQVLDAESISAGLDYPGSGPEHAFLRDSGRAEYLTASDFDASREKLTEGPNPQTGPFFVEGAESGDTLLVRFDRIHPNRDRGVSGQVVAPHVVDPDFVPRLGHEEREPVWWQLDHERA